MITGAFPFMQRIESWCPLLNAEHTVSLTALNSQAQVKTVQDIGNMPFTKFSTLYAVSFCKLAHKIVLSLSKVFTPVEFLLEIILAASQR